MVAILKQGENKKNMRKLMDNFRNSQKKKGVDVHKYCGTIQLKEDALEIQKKLRDEWG